MGLIVELVSSLVMEEKRWEERKKIAIERAKIDLDLIVPLVEDYYDARRPTLDRVVYSWEVGKGMDEFRRFLDGFMVVAMQYPGTEVKVRR